MSLISTRVRGNDPSLPTVLPGMVSALTRRRALFGAVALGVTPAAAMPAVSADAELLDLLAQHPIAHERWIALNAAMDDPEHKAREARPAKPETLRHRPGDFGGVLGSYLADSVDGGGRWYGGRAADWLRRCEPLTVWSPALKGMVPDLVAEARRAEIVEAFDRRVVDCAEVDRRVGLIAAREASEAAGDALSEIEVRIAAIRPLTLAGLVAKAAYAANTECEGTMEDVLREVAAFSLAS